jgi:hypothetical protein
VFQVSNAGPCPLLKTPSFHARQVRPAAPATSAPAPIFSAVLRVDGFIAGGVVIPSRNQAKGKT